MRTERERLEFEVLRDPDSDGARSEKFRTRRDAILWTAEEGFMLGEYLRGTIDGTEDGDDVTVAELVTALRAPDRRVALCDFMSKFGYEAWQQVARDDERVFLAALFHAIDYR